MKTRDYSHAFDETVDQPPHTNGDPNPECNGSGDPRGSWLADCILGDGKNPKPLPILANILIGIRAQWPEAIAYDEMACAAMLMKSLTGENGFTPRTLCDVDVGIIQKELQHLGLKRINKDATHQAVDIRASEHAFHPIRNSLDGLAWDSTERMGKLFINYFGAAAGCPAARMPKKICKARSRPITRTSSRTVQ